MKLDVQLIDSDPHAILGSELLDVQLTGLELAESELELVESVLELDCE